MTEYAVIESRIAGRWSERGEDRSTCDWARVPASSAGTAAVAAKAEK